MTDSLDGKTFEAGSASARGAYSLAAGSSFGKYRIVRPLGRGGMGEVYEAEHPVLHVRWALKVLPSDFASRPGAVDRFKREAEVMAKLQHPNIVRVDDFGDTDGRYWLRMELVQGIDAPGGAKAVTVADLVEAHGGRLAQEEWLDLLGQMVEGLGYAHGRGAIHRDLKPSNILLAPGSDGKPVAKIADFGLVRIVGEEWVRKSAELSLGQSMSIGPAATAGGDAHGTSTHALLGTYEYMSPEQKEGGEADERSDIYALGLMTFRILTGQKTLGFRLPSALDSRLVPGWDDLIAQSLEPDRDERLGNCEAVRTLLAEVRGQIEAGVQEAEAARRREREEEERKRKEEAERRPREQEEIEPRRRADEARRRREDEEQHRRQAAEAEARLRAQEAARWEEEEWRQRQRPRGRGKGKALVLAILAVAAALGGWWLWDQGTGSGHPGARTTTVATTSTRVTTSSAPSVAPTTTVATTSTQVTTSSARAVTTTREAVAPVQPPGVVLPRDLVAVADATTAPLTGLAPGSSEAQAKQREYVDEMGLPLEVKTARTGIVLRLVPPGTFTMGSPTTEAGRAGAEGPQREVEISSGLYVGKYEVTQGEWESVMGTNPSRFKAAGWDAPVEQVSWNDCQEFLNRLCDREGVPRGTYRLLTEAEWEYACRAGTRTAFCYGNSLDATQANFDGNYPYGSGRKGEYRQTTVKVGSFAPNAWGLYDMHGNVWEWVQDDWHGSYEGAPRDGSAWQAGPSSGSSRVYRGGSWAGNARFCRSARRNGRGPGLRWSLLGFRLARQLPPSGR